MLRSISFANRSEKIPYFAPPSLDAAGSSTSGLSPSGTMIVRVTKKKSFPSTPKSKTIEITYEIPSGIQHAYHENPGNPFAGSTRKAYLPNTSEGRKLLDRFKHAWSRGLIFDIGTSQTTGEQDVLIWAQVPHKTSLEGGQYGWPDSNYIAVCNNVLDILKVPSSDSQVGTNSNTTSPLPPPVPVPANAVRNETITYSAPESFATSTAVTGCLRPPSSNASGASGDCLICMEPLSQQRFVHIQGCAHAFHSKCILDYLNHDVKCPACRIPIGEPQGKSPSGEMSITMTRMDCPGFPHTKAIEITYDIPSGNQRSYHENPGHRFNGTVRTAYLPNNDEGRQLLLRLKYAWTHGLTFRVGTSLTSGADNAVTWASIHHKTSLQGGPHGFPDANYISNCNSSLDVLNVPVANAC